MSDRVQKAADRFKSGEVICAQAVVGAFCEDYGMDKNLFERVVCGFGSGARNAELCGAIAGAVIVIGLKYGGIRDRGQCNEKVEEFTSIFRAKQSDIVCRNLLGVDISTRDGRASAIKQGLFGTRCVDLISCAIEILESLGYGADYIEHGI